MVYSKKQRSELKQHLSRLLKSSQDCKVLLILKAYYIIVLQRKRATLTRKYLPKQFVKITKKSFKILITRGHPCKESRANILSRPAVSELTTSSFPNTFQTPPPSTNSCLIELKYFINRLLL